MEKLIKIQSVIMEIEELQNLKTEYKTTFDYQDNDHLFIECYCIQHCMNVMNILRNTEDTAWYFTSNNRIEIIDLSRFNSK